MPVSCVGGVIDEQQLPYNYLNITYVAHVWNYLELYPVTSSPISPDLLSRFKDWCQISGP